MVISPAIIIIAGLCGIIILGSTAMVNGLLLFAISGAAIFTGPILFGFEYLGNSQSYIETRPVSAGKVFWAKVLVIILITLASSVALNYAQNKYQWSSLFDIMVSIPFIWVVLLSACFWCTGFTIIFQDTIRGILIGICTIFILSIPVICVRGLCESSIFYFNDVNIKKIYMYDIVYSAGFFLIYPFLLLGALISLYKYFSRKKLCISPLLIFSLIVFILYAIFSGWSTMIDGKAYLNPLPKSNSDTFQITDMEVLGVEVVTKPVTGNAERYLTVLDLSDNQCVSRKIFMENADNPLESGYPHLIDSLSGNELLFERYYPKNKQNTCQLELYKINNGKLELLYKPFKIEKGNREYRGTFIYRDQIVICLKEVNSAEPEKSKCNLYLVNMATGEITDEIEIQLNDILYSSTKVISGDRIYIYKTKKEFKNDYYTVTILSGTSPLHLNTLGKIENFRLVAADHNLLVGTELSGEMDKLRRTGKIPQLVLYDTTNPSSPIRTVVDIPARLSLKPYLKMVSFIKNLGFPYNIPVEVRSQITLGDGYLCLWLETMGRIAVWDVHNPGSPNFLGIVSTKPFWGYFGGDIHRFAGAVSPIHHSMGLLGYVMYRNSIMWFEFPELINTK